MLLLGVIGIGVGAWLTTIVEYHQCTDNFYGDCLSYGPTYPYAVAGYLMIVAAAILAIVGAILFLQYKPAPLAAPSPARCSYCGRIALPVRGRCASCSAPI